METINISQLKAHLSAVIARVRKGLRMTVLDRKIPVIFLEAVKKDTALTIAQLGQGKFAAPRGLRKKLSSDPVTLLMEDRGRR